MIEATIAHDVPASPNGRWRKDCGVFLDFDLSILPAPPSVFDAYEDGIRREYSFVDPAMFKIGRAAILEGFLQRESLYFTPTLRDAWEATARRNLQRSLTALRRVDS